MACGPCKKAAKAILKLDQAPKNVIESRRDTCRTCEHAVPCPMMPEKKCLCGVCKCVLTLKTSLKDEKCPEGFWKE